MSPDLRVRGGTGGLAAQLEHLDHAVTELSGSASALDDARTRLALGRSALEVLPAATAGLGAVLDLEGDLLAVHAALERAAGAATTLAAGVLVAVGAYREAEAAGRSLWVIVQVALAPAAAPLARALGPHLGVVVAGTAPLLGPAEGAVPPTGAAPAAESAEPLGPPVPRQPFDVSTLTPDPAPVPPGGLDLSSVSAPGTLAPPPPGARVGVRLSTDAVQVAVALVGAVLTGGAGALLVGSSTPSLAARAASGAAARGVGDATRAAVAAAPVAPSVQATGPPRGVGDLLTRTRQVADERRGSARVRVERVRQADGSTAAIVYLPGVQSWNVDSRTPAAAGSALRAEAGLPSSYSDQVTQALQRAGVQRGEPVMLVGHSLGGVVAAQMAGDPAVRQRFDVRVVVTAGSPVGAAQVPSDVTVLALEHPDDPVPGLDGRDNPDTPQTTTVTAPTPAWTDDPHGSDGYADLGRQVDAAGDPSLVAWREQAAPFLAAEGATSEVTEVVGRTVDPTPTR